MSEHLSPLRQQKSTQLATTAKGTQAVKSKQQHSCYFAVDVSKMQARIVRAAESYTEGLSNTGMPPSVGSVVMHELHPKLHVERKQLLGRTDGVSRAFQQSIGT